MLEVREDQSLLFIEDFRKKLKTKYKGVTLTWLVAMDEFENDEAEALLALMFFDEDEEGRDSDDGEEVPYVDMEGFRRLSNSSFKSHFRMDRIVFQRLLVVVGNFMRETNRLIRLRTPLDHCLMMGLWPLFNPDTYRSSGVIFGKRKGVIHYHYSYIIEVLRLLAPRYIKWPDALERQYIKAEFEENYGYPGVVGAIDGVHIQITAPLEGKAGHIDRHHNYSMLVQAVCDHRLLYRDVYVGQPGAIGDVRNYDRSPLSSLLLTEHDMLDDDEHLVGDGAYILTSKILIPYADDGHLTDWMTTHNKALSACRVKIENTFARLKGLHRRLKFLPMRNVELLVDHIMACFMIHNFIILNGNEIEGLPVHDVRPIPDAEFALLNDQARNLGAIKREYIANTLHPHE